MWIALSIAVAEGLVAAIEKDVSRWTVIGVAVPLIAFYVWAGRSLRSDAGRQLAWIAASSQVLAVLVVIFVFVLFWLAIVAVAVLAVIALIFLFTDRT